MFVRQICFDFMTGGPFKECLNFFLPILMADGQM